MLHHDLKFLNQQVKELFALYHQAIQKYNLSDSEFWVLYSLAVIGGDFFQQDISDMWSLPKQTVNSGVLNLIKKGYICLEPISDSKRKIIRLTAKGKKFSKETIIKIFNAEERALARMNIEDYNNLIRLHEIYISLLQDEITKVDLGADSKEKI